MSSRKLKIIILTSISFSLSLILFLSNFFKMFELKAFDLFSQYMNPSSTNGDIVVIKIDQQSIDAMSRQGIMWPWPRQMYAPIIEYLSAADAVFIDILFTEPSSYGMQDDLILAETMQKASNVYLPLFLTNKKSEIGREDLEFIERMAVNDLVTVGLTYNSAIIPVDPLKYKVVGSGNVTIPPDEDGVYRKVPLFFKVGEITLPHFVVSYIMQKEKIRIQHGVFFINNRRILSTDQSLMLRYYTEESPFPEFSASEIIQSYLHLNELKKPLIEREYFRRKKVFIGLTAAGLYDLKPTATSSISTGIIIHATMLDNLLSHSFFKPLPDIYTIGFILLLCFITSFVVIRYYSIYITLSFLIMSLSTAIIVPALFFWQSYYMSITSPIISLIISFIFSFAYSYATEGKERRFIKKAFLQYMDGNIVEYLLKNPHLIKPGGQRHRATVFFADIVGFTSIAEKISAEDIAKILHTILNVFTEIIIKNKGVIDKYIGDCIMAFWGAPIKTENDEINACRSALQCLESLDEINRNFRIEGLPEISMRIGIHAGDVIVGNLGSNRLFDYTVVGDTVNVASRLESVNNLFKTKIIISEDVLQKTEKVFFVRELGKVEVKGKTIPVKIFELISENLTITNDQKEIVELFHKGIMLFNQREYHEAINIFNRIMKKSPNDGPAIFYRKRCEMLKENPNLTSECGIIKINEK